MPAKLRLRDTLASIHPTRGAAFTWRPLQKMYGYKSLSPVLIFHQSEYCILAFFGKYWLLNWHEIADVQIRFTFTRFNLLSEWVLINFAFGQILANWHDRFAAICTTSFTVQINNYEIVVFFPYLSAITWHDIQQLFINLPKFTQFVQLMNWQNNSSKFV